MAKVIITEEQLKRIVLSEMTSKEIDAEAEKVNTNPTEAEKEAGNYKMAHVRVKGFPITIETPKGAKRSWKDKDGKVHYIKMKNHYGYFRLTNGEGKDGDAVDVFIGPKPESFETVYIVDQKKPNGEFDESKVMLGFTSEKSAKNAYFANYSKNWKGFMSITPATIAYFKKWLYDKRRQRKPFSEYADLETA